MTEHQHPCHQGLRDHEEHTVKDPVCGMIVDPYTAEQRSQHGTQTYIKLVCAQKQLFTN